MSYIGRFCPNCDNHITAPLMPLDYYKCNSCMGSIHVDDLVIRKTHTIALAGPSKKPFSFQKIGETTFVDDYQLTDTVTATAKIYSQDFIVVAVSTSGANQPPTSVTSGGQELSQIEETGSQSHARAAMYYFQANATCENVQVYWSGQHPISAIVSVYRLTGLDETNPFSTQASIYGGPASSVSDYAGGAVSPTPDNVFAMYLLTVDGSDILGNPPTGYATASYRYTGSSLGDNTHGVFYQEVPTRRTLLSGCDFSYATYYAQVMVLFRKA